MVKVTAGIAIVAIVAILGNIAQFSLLREQGKKITMMEAANETLTKELYSVNRRIVSQNKAREEGQKFKIEVEKANEKNRDWAGDVVPADVVDGLCTKTNCAESKLQMSTPRYKD